MVVIYYASTNFLDVVLETIQSIKNKVELHLVIEITETSKRGTIVDVTDIQSFKIIESGEKVLGKEKWEHLKPYLDGVASVDFIIHKNRRALSPKSLLTAFKLGRYLKKYKADIVHFDTISSRAIGMYAYLRSKKVFMAIHDSKQHSGEEDWRDDLPNYIFFKLSKGYFFYSIFSCNQFIKNYKNITVGKFVLKLQPYSSFRYFISNKKSDENYILFFGRISYYKGIDLLLEAIPLVVKKFPHQKFIIAGNPGFGYKMDEELINQCKGNIEVKIGYLNAQELTQLIENAKFIVCPYRDASQSGVLMTSFALGKMAVATNVGAFPEYIEDGINGVLMSPTVKDIADKLIYSLENDKYKEIEKNIHSEYSKEISHNNQVSILSAYNNAL